MNELLFTSTSQAATIFHEIVFGGNMFTDTQREEILNKVAKILVEHGTVCASDAITDGCPVNGNIRGYIKSLVRDLVDDAFVETLGIMKEKVNEYPLSLKINISMG